MRASAAFLLATTTLAAPLGSQAVVPIRQLGRTVAVSSVTFTRPREVRAIPKGGLLVNDMVRRVVLSLDSLLGNPVAVIDSVDGRPNSYGPRALRMFAATADSSLLFDPTTLSMIVLDPAGRLVRHIAAPSSLPPAADPAMSGRGQLVYRMPVRAASGGARGAARGVAPPSMPDSAFVVGYDFATRILDTIATIRIGVNSNLARGAGATVPPAQFQSVDLWAVTSTGRVAIVRGRDFHVDWINADNTRTSSSRIAHEWVRFPDDAKQRVADSVAASMNATLSAQAVAAGGTPIVDAAGKITGYTLPPRAGPPGAPPPPPTVIQLRTVSALSIPEYLPPYIGTTANVIYPDGDGGLWIRVHLLAPPPGGPVYDVIDGTGKLVDRVQVPESKTVIGFGPGVVYLLTYDAAIARIEKVRIR